MTENDLDLLGQFVHEHSQDAFTALVNRHLNLVYSAALRQVRSHPLAEEVSQSVFTNLALNAAKLTPDTILTAWLYRVTRHAAIDVIRGEARRQAREQISLQMSELNNSPADWAHIEPLLDEAMDSLEDADRTAILLRYFQNKSLREVGEALGASEDAAQKRVSRAVERLQEFFSKRKMAIGAGALVALVSANAVEAAPGALSGVIAAGAFAASTTLSSTTAITATKIISFTMTTTQKIVVTTLVAGGLAIGVYQSLQTKNLRQQVATLQQQEGRIEELRRERNQAKDELSKVTAENQTLKKRPSDVLKLRGEVGQLKRENVDMGSKSALSKVTANPEARKMLREQQKMGMGMIYKGFAQQANLTAEQTEKLNDLLADYVMENVGHITTILRDKPAPEEMAKMFAAQDGVLQGQVQELVGADGLTQFQNYSKNILSDITAQQFKTMLTGTDAEKDAKSQQLSQTMQEEVATALANANLPANYQAMPMLNFMNIASEQQGQQSLDLLSNIYQRVTARTGSFLSSDEQAKFQEFTTMAINNTRSGLALNRTMMAPIAN